MLQFCCHTDPGRAGHELRARRNLSQKHKRSRNGEHRGMAEKGCWLSLPQGFHTRLCAGELQVGQVWRSRLPSTDRGTRRDGCEEPRWQLGEGIWAPRAVPAASAGFPLCWLISVLSQGDLEMTVKCKSCRVWGARAHCCPYVPKGLSVWELLSQLPGCPSGEDTG